MLPISHLNPTLFPSLAFHFFPRYQLSLHPSIFLYGSLQVKNLTTNIQLILDSLRASTIVEVQVNPLFILNCLPRNLLAPLILDLYVLQHSVGIMFLHSVKH